MIVIRKPYIKVIDDKVRLCNDISIDNREETVWYEVDERYNKYLVTEQCDAFLVALLPYAMKIKKDIKIESAISERLLYCIKKYLMKAISIALPYTTEIDINAEKVNGLSLKCKNEVGTGYSAGIDSFFTIYDHLDENCPSGYKVTSFAYLNVGSHGSGGEESEKLFNDRYKLISPYIKETNKNIVIIDSNISDIINMNYTDTSTFRCVSAILAVQKYFKAYYCSSSVRVDDYQLAFSAERYDILNLKMLSTETTEFFSTGTQYNRFEKTKKVSEYEPSTRYLNVCVKESNNCSMCYKCMRTQFTLELLGKLDDYKKVFDINKYKKKRNIYIAKILIADKKDTIPRDIYLEMKKRKLKIPLTSYILVIPLLIKRILGKPILV